MRELSDAELEELRAWVRKAEREVERRRNRIRYLAAKLSADLDGGLDTSEVSLLVQRVVPLAVADLPMPPPAVYRIIASRAEDGLLPADAVVLLAADAATEAKVRWREGHQRKLEERREERRAARERERMAMHEFSAVGGQR